MASPRKVDIRDATRATHERFDPRRGDHRELVEKLAGVPPRAVALAVEAAQLVEVWDAATPQRRSRLDGRLAAIIGEANGMGVALTGLPRKVRRRRETSGDET